MTPRENRAFRDAAVVLMLVVALGVGMAIFNQCSLAEQAVEAAGPAVQRELIGVTGPETGFVMPSLEAPEANGDIFWNTIPAADREPPCAFLIQSNDGFQTCFHATLENADKLRRLFKGAGMTYTETRIEQEN